MCHTRCDNCPLRAKEQAELHKVYLNQPLLLRQPPLIMVTPLKSQLQCSCTNIPVYSSHLIKVARKCCPQGDWYRQVSLCVMFLMDFQNPRSIHCCLSPPPTAHPGWRQPGGAVPGLPTGVELLLQLSGEGDSPATGEELW